MQSYKSKLDKKIEKIAIGSDHGGYHLKEKIKDYLHSMGYMYEDFGTHSTKSVDYPDYAALVARAVSSGQCDKGIVIDGAGIGSCIVANKVNGILGALCHDRFTARIAREHDNANILCLGAKVVNDMESREILRTFLNTPFAGGRHTRRIDKILEVEKQETKQKGEPPKC
ncbi:MAG: ribose 5-phosphate isomerase B [Spirochaetes bacterium]|nr:ribose 5-phosphate isomerase B [Spirochaetota bacterium]